MFRFLKSRRFWIWFTVLALVITLVLLSIFVFFADRSHFTVSRLRTGFEPGETRSTFSSSFIDLHDNNTFAMQINHNDVAWFSAIGTWSRSGSNIRLTFLDASLMLGGIMQQDQSGQFKGETISFPATRREITFTDHLGRVFVFRN